MSRAKYFGEAAFPHSIYATQDTPLQMLADRHGPSALGAYWALAEKLYQAGEDGIGPYDLLAAAMLIRMDRKDMEAVVATLEELGVLEREGEGPSRRWRSERVLEVLQRKAKSREDFYERQAQGGRMRTTARTRDTRTREAQAYDASSGCKQDLLAGKDAGSASSGSSSDCKQTLLAGKDADTASLYNRTEQNRSDQIDKNRTEQIHPQTPAAGTARAGAAPGASGSAALSDVLVSLSPLSGLSVSSVSSVPSAPPSAGSAPGGNRNWIEGLPSGQQLTEDQRRHLEVEYGTNFVAAYFGELKGRIESGQLQLRQPVVAYLTGVLKRRRKEAR